MQVKCFQNEIRRNLKEKDNIVKKMQNYLKSTLNLDSKNMVLKKEEFLNIKKIKENIISELENEDKCSVLDNFSNYCFKFRKYELALMNHFVLNDYYLVQMKINRSLIL